MATFKVTTLIAGQIIEPGEQELVALRATVSKLEQRVQVLDDERESRNEDLYMPVFASRELAIVNLLMYQRDLLDELVKKEIRVKALEIEKDASLGNHSERKEAKKTFLKQFGSNQKLSYFQLVRAWENNNNQVFHEVLVLVEQAFLDDYENQGCMCGEAINVRSSMQALRLVKRCRDQSAAHVFDFDFMEKGSTSLKQQRASQKLQASVLLDLQNAIKKNWLQGYFKTLGNPHSGTLLLEIARRMKELE